MEWWRGGEVVSKQSKELLASALRDENRDMYYALLYGQLFVDQYKQLVLENIPKLARKQHIPELICDNLFFCRKRVAISLYCKHVINRDPYKEAHDGTMYKDGSPVEPPYTTPLPFP